jgi:hypothetical protein
VILLWPSLSWAATWCVPGETIAKQCSLASGTIQGAIDGATPGDIILVGPGNPAERIVISKRVRIQGLPGHLITDKGLPPSGHPLIGFSGTFQAPGFEKLHLDVVNSPAGVVIPRTVGNVQFRGVQITSAATPAPAYGLQVNGGTRMYFLAAAGEPGRVAGFEVGIELDNVFWHDVEGGAVIEGNGVGLRVTHGKGQIFWNTFRNNGVGLEARGIFHTDTNNNDFIGNGIGLLWGLADAPHPLTGLRVSRQTEFDHNDFIDNGVAFQIEVPGSPAYSPSMYDNPGCTGRWNNNEVDGTVLTPFKTGLCPIASVSHP